MRRIRVLSYNIHRGVSTLRGRDTLVHMAETLQNAGADVICLQEVLRPEGSFLFEESARQRWEHQIFGKCVVRPSGLQGNCVWSRFPVGSWSNEAFAYWEREARFFLRADLEVGNGKRLTVVNTHLGLRHRERRRQIRAFGEYLRRAVAPEHPLIVAGDFNDWRGQLGEELEGKLGLKEALTVHTGKPRNTFPSWLPAFPLDRIYYRNLRLVGAHVVRAVRLSDHLPVEAEFLL